MRNLHLGLDIVLESQTPLAKLYPWISHCCCRNHSLICKACFNKSLLFKKKKPQLITFSLQKTIGREKHTFLIARLYLRTNQNMMTTTCKFYA